MKKMVFFLIITLFFYTTSFAQFSMQGKYEIKGPEAKKSVPNAWVNVPGLDNITQNDTLSRKKLYTTIDSTIKAITKTYLQKRLFILSQDKIEDKDDQIDSLIKKRDILIGEQKKLKRLVKYWDRYDRFEEVEQSSNFFPAYYSTQAIRFFEDDSVHLKLFQNNLVNYNPKTKKMTLYTEVVNDYVGPFRVGIGYQIKSTAKVDSLSTTDSTKKLEKKADVLSDIQNGGGDISINVKYPLVKSGNSKSVFQYKFYLYANSGFSLPVLNKASEDFLFNYDGGVEGAVYAKGFNNRITFYSQIKVAYYNGNKNYRKIISDANKNDPNAFVMFQTSFGLDFMDGYRLRVDLFSGNAFIKRNFPASVTFIVRPGKSKQ